MTVNVYDVVHHVTQRSTHLVITFFVPMTDTHPRNLIKLLIDVLKEECNWIDNPKHDELIAKATAYLTQAARWGADQELEACCEFVGAEGWTTAIAAELRAARRPKPSSLKPMTDINPHDDIERLSLHLRDCVQKADSNWAYVNIDVLLDAAEYLERFAHGGGFNG